MDVLLVDDEAVYRNGLVALVQRSTNLAGRVNVRCARDANEALAAVAEAQRPPDLLIQDVDLGPASQDGFEVVRELRKRGFRGFVCVHSNRFLSTHDASAQEAGADDVIPKPMSRAQLLALLSNIAQKSAEAAAAGAGGVAGTRAEGEAPAHAQVRASSVADAPLPEIAYIDDALSFLVGMRVKVKGKAILHEFRSPTEFLARMEAETDFIGTLACIVTDFHFASDEPLDGLAFARRLRARGYSRPIVLASGTVQEFAPDEANTFSGRVDKPLGDWAQLEPWTRG
jgi:CheY-like chemotaxis protein